MSSDLDVRAANTGRGIATIPALNVEGPWDKIVAGRGKAALEALLPGILKSRRWFGGKGRSVRSAAVVERAAIEYREVSYYVCLIRVQYHNGAPETYVLPLTFVPGGDAEKLLDVDPAGALLRLNTASGGGVVYDAARDGHFACALLDLIAGEQTLGMDAGEIDGIRTSRFRPPHPDRLRYVDLERP